MNTLVATAIRYSPTNPSLLFLLTRLAPMSRYFYENIVGAVNPTYQGAHSTNAHGDSLVRSMGQVVLVRVAFNLELGLGFHRFRLEARCPI